MIDNAKKPATINHSSEKSRDKFLPETFENAGNNNKAMISAMTKAIMLINRDSPRNCLIKRIFTCTKHFTNAHFSRTF